MKRIVAILVVLSLLLPIAGLAEAIVIQAGGSPAAVTEIKAGAYQATLAQGASDGAFALVDMSTGQTGDVFSLDSMNPSAVVTVKDGQSIMMLSGSISLLPLDNDQAAAIKAADPYVHAIDGVDLHVAFSKAEEVSGESGDFPLLKSVGFDYNDQMNSISITLFLLDEATPAIAKTYAYDMVRLVNTCCIYQNTSILPSAPKYLGGIYDKVNCNVFACKWSDMPDVSKALVQYIIPVGTQGFGTIDGSQLE